MTWLFGSGHAVDVVLAVMAAEAVWLVGRQRWRVVDVALCIMPGALMLLALRASLTGGGWLLMALFLALSFPVHLGDLYRRSHIYQPD